MTRFRVYSADVFELLGSLADASVDCIVTDPPYESLEKHRAKGTTTRLKVSDGSSNEWFETIPNACFPRLFAEFHRVLRKNSHLYVYCDSETMFEAKPAAEAAGFRFWKPLVWDKATIGMGYHYRARCEFILFFEKGKRKLNDLGIPDVLDDETCDARLGLSPGESLRLREPRVRDGYPTEKPVPVSRVLIRQSTVVGELVLDPFMGSGSVGDAALREGRRFIGCDVKPNAVELAWSRLRPLINP